MFSLCVYCLRVQIGGKFVDKPFSSQANFITKVQVAMTYLQRVSCAINKLENPLPFNYDLGKHAESWKTCGMGSHLLGVNASI